MGAVQGKRRMVSSVLRRRWVFIEDWAKLHVYKHLSLEGKHHEKFLGCLQGTVHPPGIITTPRVWIRIYAKKKQPDKWLLLS